MVEQIKPFFPGTEVATPQVFSKLRPMLESLRVSFLVSRKSGDLPASVVNKLSSRTRSPLTDLICKISRRGSRRLGKRRRSSSRCEECGKGNLMHLCKKGQH